MMKTAFLLFLAVLCLSAFSFGSTTACQSSYQVGLLNFCVTANGNISEFYSGTLNGAEGYGICAPDGSIYYDLGLYGDSGNWAPPVITQPKGPNTFPLTIVRNTMGGQFSVTQQFSFAGAGSSVLVKLTVMTSSKFSQDATFFRYADVPGVDQYGDQTLRTAFAWNRGGSGMTAARSATGQAQLIAGGSPNPCNWTVPTALPLAGDAATLLTWTWRGGKLKTSFNYSPIR